MKSVSGTLFFKPMKEEPEEHHWSSLPSYKLHLKIMQTSKGPYLRVSHTIKENPTEDGPQWIRLPYLPGEKCLDKSTGEVVTILSCEPVRVENVTREDCARLDREHLIDTSLAYNEYPLNYQQTAFRDQWRKRHPGKWAWRVESEVE
jgi:hypothetical protein